MSFRSRGSRGYTYRGSSFRNSRAPPSTAPSDVLPPDRNLYEGLKKSPLETIRIPSDDVNLKAEIRDVHYLGSYNWLKRDKDDDVPTIVVPGSPHEWLNRPTPYLVAADVGNFFQDQNGYHLPKAVLQSLLLAADETEEGKSFDWSSVDIVTDRNGLRKLLRWIRSPTDGLENEKKEFRIDLQLAGKRTVLFNRWDKRYRQRASGFTFGFNFEKESTKEVERCEGTTGHHRIISYDFGGLKMVVRFEVDACIVAPTTSAPNPKGKASSSSSTDIDSLTSALSSVKIRSGASLPPSSLPSKTLHGLKIIQGTASAPPQSALVELTTVSQKRHAGFDWKEQYPQLYLSQTPHHFLGVHQQGRFVLVEKRRTTSMSEGKDMLGDIRRLRKVLGVIIELVKRYGEKGRVSIVFDGRSGLTVYERENKDSCLPDELMKRFV